MPQSVQDRTLRIAQWYDYWPGSVLTNFVDLIRNRYGVTIDISQEIYTSDQEVFTWITTAGKKFDLIFPADFNVEQMVRAGLLYNMNKDWLPNYGNLFPWLKDPAQNRYAYPNGRDLYAVPYQWGTTGLGFRTDKGWTRDDIRQAGMELFWMDQFMGVDLSRKVMMLDENRECFGLTYKRLGWNEQLDLGWAPTNLTANPAAPYDGEYQWSQNETGQARLDAATQALIDARSRLYAFNTVNQGPYLTLDVVYIDMAWSGDIMYAIRPHTSTPQPVDYVIPEQGGTRWVTNAAIPRDCRNLWLVHEFINYLLDPEVGANITDWNLYATPNAESFDLLTAYPSYGWDPREDERIYADLAFGYSGPPILERCEFQHDLGPEATIRFLTAWNDVKFS